MEISTRATDEEIRLAQRALKDLKVTPTVESFRDPFFLCHILDVEYRQYVVFRQTGVLMLGEASYKKLKILCDPGKLTHWHTLFKMIDAQCKAKNAE